MIKDTEKVPSSGQTEKSTKGSGQMENNTELGSIRIQREKKRKENGSMEKDKNGSMSINSENAHERLMNELGWSSSLSG